MATSFQRTVRALPISQALALEAEMLADTAAHHRDAELLIWSTEQCLVVPYSMPRLAGFDRACRALETCGWPVHVRSTGGDVTPQGPGIVNVSLIYRTGPQSTPRIDTAYDVLCCPILDALSSLGIAADRGALDGAFCDGAHNINIAGKKFAGTAQRWKRSRPDRQCFAVLAHALLLIEPPSDETIAAINRFYEFCELPKRISSRAHTGLVAAAGLAENPDLSAVFLEDLPTRYQSVVDADDQHRHLSIRP